MPRSQLWKVGLCLATLLILAATALPTAFTIDDCNYLSSVVGLRHGTLFLPGTAGLPASRALYAFEPTALTLQNPVTPVPPLIPPLYALVAYPFSYLGWYGLVLVNILASVATLALVFMAARRLAGKERAGWYAAALWFLGASTIEYAQGLWPQMLTVALTTSGLILAALATANRRHVQAMAAGFLLALAAGIRYQNAVLLASGFVILLAWGQARLRSALAYCLGALPPVLACALINHARIGSWHPWSKSVHYTAITAGAGGGSGGGSFRPLQDFALSLWTRVVGYSAQPPFRDQAQSYMRKLASGDIVTQWGVLKKSWLQASPWMLVGLLAVVLAWSRRDYFADAARKHLRHMAVPLLAVLGTFGLAGVYRHDGLTFNQRYLLELAPLMAIAVAVGLSNVSPRWPFIAAGSALGTGAAACVLLAFAGPTGYRLQSLVPLALAGAAACLWLLSLSRPRLGGPAGLAVAACLAWSLAVHLSTDLVGSRRARHFNLGRLGLVEEVLVPTRPAAILTAGGTGDAFCPLQLDHDLVVVADNGVSGAELPPLLDALLARRRVLLWLETFPKATLASLHGRYRIEMVRPPMLAEIKN
jgi:hypothetical protein